MKITSAHKAQPTHESTNASAELHLSEEELIFYIDRELSESERLEVERHCEGCERCAQKMSELSIVHQLFAVGSDAGEPLTEGALDAERKLTWNELSSRLDYELKREPPKPKHVIESFIQTFKRRFQLVTFASLSVAVVFLSTTGFKSTLVDFAITSHEQRWPSEVSPQQLDQVEAWFAQHSEGGQPLEVPRFHRLDAAGVHLETARLSLALVAEGRWERSAHLVYRFKDSDQRLTVVAFRGSAEALEEGRAHEVAGVDVHIMEQGSLRVASYQRAGLSYMLTSNLHEGELLKLIGADLITAHEEDGVRQQDKVRGAHTSP
jgi:anti-sigma factor RsiW